MVISHAEVVKVLGLGIDSRGMWGGRCGLDIDFGMGRKRLRSRGG
jgi:hypothetical protein